VNSTFIQAFCTQSTMFSITSNQEESTSDIHSKSRIKSFISFLDAIDFNNFPSKYQAFAKYSGHLNQ